MEAKAYIHPEAKIGENVTVEPFAFIEKDVEIESGTWIGPHAVISEGARIGKNCKIYPGACVSAIPQDLKFAGELTKTYIGEGTVLREYTTISRGTTDRMETVIGKNSLVMAYAHVAHDCIVGDNVIVGNTVQVAGHVTIGDWAIISGLTGIHQFMKIGPHAFIASNSVVNKDVPPFVKAARNPLTYAGINSVGLIRRGYSQETVQQLHDLYRKLYFAGANMSAAIGKVEEEVQQSPEVDLVLNFIKDSQRGIIKKP